MKSIHDWSIQYTIMLEDISTYMSVQVALAV